MQSRRKIVLNETTQIHVARARLQFKNTRFGVRTLAQRLHQTNQAD
jgi:hypothetical protein